MARKSDFVEYVRARYEGRIKIDEFLRLSKPVLEAVATKLLRRWRVPTAVALDDVVQELMVGCCRAFNRYEPARGTPIERYVMYNACDKAKKWIHHQRGARLHGNSDAHPPRYDLLFSAVYRRDDAEPDDVLRRFAIEPSQETRLLRREHVREILAGAPRRIGWGILALEAADGCQGAAVDNLYRDPKVRLRLRLGSIDDARDVVNQAVQYLQST
jgi:DNA-directed RNA polymerase specialized sigma24 family protein